VTFNALAVDTSSIYVTSATAGIVGQFPIDGGALTTLSNDSEQPLALALAPQSAFAPSFPTELFVANDAPTQGAASILGINLPGGSTFAFASGTSGVMAIATDANNVYWIDSEGVKQAGISSFGAGPIISLATEGVDYQSGLSPAVPALGIALDSTSVYWTTGTGDTVLRAPIAGDGGVGGPITVATGVGGTASSLAVYGGYVYWLDLGPASEVNMAPANGSSGPLGIGAATSPALAADASGVYWATTGGGFGVVARMPIGVAGGATTVYSGNLAPAAIALTAANVYVAANDSNGVGSVLTIVKH
jgi:hypothetical protein